MTMLLVIHGSGMCMRGKAETKIFGAMTLPEYVGSAPGPARGPAPDCRARSHPG
jgi:hypothetical protein